MHINQLKYQVEKYLVPILRPPHISDQTHGERKDKMFDVFNNMFSNDWTTFEPSTCLDGIFYISPKLLYNNREYNHLSYAFDPYHHFQFQLQNRIRTRKDVDCTQFHEYNCKLNFFTLFKLFNINHETMETRLQKFLFMLI